ncbi:ATPase [Recurvomyces mirabilis]|uniref:ATPase n=1 Tax=Recurvomyces mirabilis TaxID=574656 RepID=A0AAE1C554_9PEZI|nr:ATPase [Recurvomyces mirabilis]KAK5150161.1 ATPase [Recurvomyces mirabilis]
MASPEAIRALRSLLRGVRKPTHVNSQQRRRLCSECLTKRRQLGLRTQDPLVASRVTHTTQCPPIRTMATMADYRQREYRREGPLQEYNNRVEIGKLRAGDEHQHMVIQSLQDLYDELLKYNPPIVKHPTIDSLQPKKSTFFGSLFGGNSGGAAKLSLGDAPGRPKGLYLYGSVGSGKTMLLDLFYESLPKGIKKERIHFHNYMQELHHETHKMKMAHGNDIDAVPFVAASMAEKATILCLDEFQVTDVADAMILRRVIESLMAHGVVLITTSNRHPKDLYQNGIQRQSFIPCINLLREKLRVINIDSTTDYRVYHHPLDTAAKSHADHWFKFLGDKSDAPHEASHTVWGREIHVPRASGKACHFTFNELMGTAMGAADYIELVRNYDAFIVTDVPGMNIRSRDLARRFITFLDAAYESRAKLVLTTAVPLTQLFMAEDEIGKALSESAEKGDKKARAAKAQTDNVSDAMRSLMDDLGLDMDTLKKSSIFTGDEEAFAFARALSRLSEMGSQEWVERGLGIERMQGLAALEGDGAAMMGEGTGAAKREMGGKQEVEDWKKVRSSWRQDSY